LKLKARIVKVSQFGCLAFVVLGLNACQFLSNDQNRDPRAQDLDLREVIQSVLGVDYEDDSDVKTHVYIQNGVVLVTGNVATKEQKSDIAALLSKIVGIKTLHNELVVGEATGIGARVGDGILQNRVRLAFLNHAEIPHGKMQVVVRDNVVYLLGIVTEEERDYTNKIVENLNGVERLVSLLELSQ